MDFHFFERKKTAVRKTSNFLRLNMGARRFCTIVIHIRFANFFAFLLISIKKSLNTLF